MKDTRRGERIRGRGEKDERKGGKRIRGNGEKATKREGKGYEGGERRKEDKWI